MIKLNLHLHSNYSDGFYSVEKILEEADKQNFSYVAITDHNEIRGSLKSGKVAKKYKVKIIYGVELFFLYKGKITELLVYFRKPNEIIGFYNDFIGNKLLPSVRSPQALMEIVNKYEGFIIQPHPKALKGAIRNGFILENNLEVKNPMVRERTFNDAVREFGGADLHLFTNSLKCYTAVDNMTNISELWSTKNLNLKAINEFNITRWKRLLQSLINTVLVAKFLIYQLVVRKILRKGNLEYF